MQKFQFAGYVLENGTLTRAGRVIHVPPKEMATLILLLEEQGGLVTKDKIFDEVWGDLEVSLESLTRCIYVLRTIFAMHTEHQLIKTVHKRGYRFDFPVTVEYDQYQRVSYSHSVLNYKKQEQLEYSMSWVRWGSEWTWKALPV